MNAAMMKKRLNPVDEQIGQQIRRRRLQAGLSQEALGDKCNITFQQIQKYEKGSNRISGSRMVQLCAILKCTPNELTGYDGTGVQFTNTDPFLLLAQTHVGLTLATSFVKLPRELQRRFATLIEDIAGIE